MCTLSLMRDFDVNHLRYKELSAKHRQSWELEHEERYWIQKGNFKWTTNHAKTLGLLFCNNIRKKLFLKKKYPKKSGSLKNFLKEWQYRKLTLMGKINTCALLNLILLDYINIFALPDWYQYILYSPFTVLPTPNELMKVDLKKKKSLLFVGIKTG